MVALEREQVGERRLVRGERGVDDLLLAVILLLAVVQSAEELLETYEID